ncbi:hypothetical protein EOI86_14770 [Hwanghaeella grinnelliae]|uniref:SAM-dependent chlorinase/fluorinase n=1 Tax=Hwanghaeella grinnelliae TaxID=2500179 RepID=A0A3S2VQ90_9PROT|nr:SAM-dependent chlorinase/fluorinase [Hwanghaeella grinnelliae]RVU36460.1 hypothetical protein EOI86_14770 [Hwanghaeella grinnelliae]
MILFFTDFGWLGPYIGQMHTAVVGYANTIPIVDLMHDAPAQDPKAAAYLLAALAPAMPAECVCVGVVDPGVGTDRDAIVLRTGNRFFVGPDNGLFSLTARHSDAVRWYRIVWRPETLSASFHGRDLFAPIAARIAARTTPGQEARCPASASWMDGLVTEISGPAVSPEWADDIDEVIYIDSFGNCILGRRAMTVDQHASIHVPGETLGAARTFGDAPEGSAFWYANSMGMVEIAVNKGNAAERFGLKIGTPVQVH